MIRCNQGGYLFYRVYPIRLDGTIAFFLRAASYQCIVDNLLLMANLGVKMVC